jgi:hypothetical protein
MTTASRKPVSGSRVNITPDAPTSDRTIFCTTTDSATSSCPKPWSMRYEMARSVKRLAKHWLTARRSAGSPRTLRKLSCWPANEAVGRSSAVADDRTATSVSAP